MARTKREGPVRWHISPDGVARECDAKPGDCLFGETYASKTQADKMLAIVNLFDTTSTVSEKTTAPPVVSKPHARQWLGLEPNSPGERSLEELRRTGLGYALYAGEPLYHGSPTEFSVGDIIVSKPDAKNRGDLVAYATPDEYLANVFCRDSESKTGGWVYQVEPVNPVETIHSKMNYPDSRNHIETLTSSGYRVISVKKIAE